MDSLTGGATERTIADDRGLGALRGSHASSGDHLRRLCASLAEATRLVSLSGGVLTDEGAPPGHRVHSLDVLAFAMAVDTVLFLDEVREGVPLSRDTRAWLGRTLTAIDRLLHFLCAPQESDPIAARIDGSLRDARENLGKTARSLRARLSAHHSFRVVAEFQSPGPVDGKAANQAGSYGKKGRN